jgi:uncharacterized protein DUF4333
MLRSRAVSSGTPLHPTLAFLLILSVAAGSCAPRTLNTHQLEERLGRQLSDRLGVSSIVAECPEDVEVRRGGTFTCTAHARGEAEGLRIDVTQIDEEGNVTWEIAGTAG